jgi:hypothetical protein
MEQAKDPEIAELRSLAAKIRKESALLKNVILSREEEGEISGIVREFDDTIRAQVFSTIDHLSAYQLYEWRELMDGGDDSKDGAGPSQG